VITQFFITQHETLYLNELQFCTLLYTWLLCLLTCCGRVLNYKPHVAWKE